MPRTRCATWCRLRRSRRVHVLPRCAGGRSGRYVERGHDHPRVAPSRRTRREMGYVRFVIDQRDAVSTKRQGLFQALGELRDRNLLDPRQVARHDAAYVWFRMNLRKPRRLARSRKRHATAVALSWFKDSALEHIRRMRELADILETHGVRVHMVTTERPGYIVYEDRFQVAAEPFSETTT